MTKENQKQLYNHFAGIADNSIKDHRNVDFKPIIRENCSKHAAEILESFPEFEAERTEIIKKAAAAEEAKAKAEEKIKADEKAAAEEAAQKAADEAAEEVKDPLLSKTNDELKAMLDEKSIEYNATATKADLIALIGAENESTA